MYTDPDINITNHNLITYVPNSQQLFKLGWKQILHSLKKPRSYHQKPWSSKECDKWQSLTWEDSIIISDSKNAFSNSVREKLFSCRKDTKSFWSLARIFIQRWSQLFSKRLSADSKFNGPVNRPFPMVAVVQFKQVRKPFSSLVTN